MDPWHNNIKGNQNHNNWSYKVCMTRVGWLITRYSKHFKATPITSEQYLRDWLSKHRKTDTLKDIIIQFENQTEQDKDCKFRSHTTTTKPNNIAVVNKTEISARIKSPLNVNMWSANQMQSR